jgi:hypothetical protein
MTSSIEPVSPIESMAIYLGIRIYCVNSRTGLFSSLERAMNVQVKYCITTFSEK